MLGKECTGIAGKAEAPKEPTPGFKRTLLSKSLQKSSWTEACAEWAIVDCIEVDAIYGEDAPPSLERLDFVPNCELCGAKLQKHNFVIENESTAEQLRVGSDCVKRFKTLKGISAGDVAAYVDRYERDKIHITTIRRLAVAFGTKVIVLLHCPTDSCKRFLCQHLSLRAPIALA